MHTLRSTTIDVIVGDYKSHRNNTPGARCINSVASSGLREYPILPGLSNDSSPLEHETDLVQQSISALSTLNLEKYGACRNNNNNTLSVTNYENDQYYSKYNCSK
ncbi:unnamed protein product [Trichobilharzia regenti]|nr:unnamed protein product [Trichobilharzia regenti]